MRITISVLGIRCRLALRYPWRIMWLFRKTWLSWTSDVQCSFLHFVACLHCELQKKKNILSFWVFGIISQSILKLIAVLCDLSYLFFLISPPYEIWRCGTRGEFLVCCSILKGFYLKWKAFDLPNKMRYILWVVALLEACDVTNNCRHLLRHIEFYRELEIG